MIRPLTSGGGLVVCSTDSVSGKSYYLYPYFSRHGDRAVERSTAFEALDQLLGFVLAGTGQFYPEVHTYES